MEYIRESFPEWAKPTSLETATLAGIMGLIYVLITSQATTLRKVPGPFLANFTNLWIFEKQRSYKRPLVDMKLHKKYGPIVRTGPCEVLVSSPQSFKTIYGAGSSFAKAEWYIGTSDCGWGGPDDLDFLNEANMEKYRMQRRAIGPAYTADAVKDYEENLNEILKKDIQIMHDRAGQTTDLDLFLNTLTSDCLATATFSKCMNQVEAGKPNQSILVIHEVWKYIHVIGFFPHIHRFVTWWGHTFGKYTAMLTRALGIIMPWKAVAEGKLRGEIGPFAYPIKLLQERFAERESKTLKNDCTPDILSKLFSLQASSKSLVGKDHWISKICMTNFGAGVETTAIVIGALITNIISHPGCQEKIHAEIDKAVKEGRLVGSGEVPVTRDMEEQLPYLRACLRESMRVHGILGMPLVRRVPDGGRELEGVFIPAGTTVGINMWVLHRDRSLYGEDAEEWRPERWLEYSEEKIRTLEPYNMSFGAGARSCPGKHLAAAVYMKAIPMLLRDFEWGFSEEEPKPDLEAKLKCTFSTRFVGLMVQWRERKGEL
ncbi:benzoate 4-monooxygenase cytochrome P450 [Halenospora varia]|nr:benzoate 4-monooxygenase cytochrome P450 [Halenospora varia]